MGMGCNRISNNGSKSKNDKFNGKTVGIMSNDGSLKDSIKSQKPVKIIMTKRGKSDGYS